MANNVIKFSTLAANYGAYCLTVADELTEAQLYKDLDSIKNLGIKLVEGIKDEHQYAIPFVKDVLQQGKGAFDGTSEAIDFVCLKWKMRKARVNHSFIEDEFDGTFLQHYKSASVASGSNISLSEYFLAMIIKKMKENTESAIWRGVYNATKIPGVAEPLKVVDGFLKLIADAIVALTTVPITTGAITNVNAVTAFTDMWKGLTDKTISLPSVTYASPRNVIKFVENYTAIGGENNLVINFVMNQWLKANGDINKMTLPSIPLPVSGGLNMITPVWGMGTSNRLITTSRINGGMMAVGMGDSNDLAKLKTTIDHYNIDTMIDFSISTNMGAFSIDGEHYTRVNEQV
jgi:hypothetical protein